MPQKLTSTTVSYQTFLLKLRKKNGDKLLPSTIERYVENLNPYSDKLKDMEISELIPFMNSMIKKRASLVLYSAFRNYLMFLGYDRVDNEDIFDKLKTPPMSANAFSSKRFIQSKILSRLELKKVFFGCKNDFERSMFSILYDTACRRSELLKMRMKDIVFKEVGKDDSEIADGVYADILIHGKGGKTRTCCLSKLSVELLKKRSLEPDSDDLIFEFQKIDGTPYQVQSQKLYETIVKTCDKILNRHVNPHAFRHSKLTHLADDGASVLGIMAYAGHEDIKTSQIYIEISSFIGTRMYAKYSRPIIDEEDNNGNIDITEE